jgi:hypothetical protein
VLLPGKVTTINAIAVDPQENVYVAGSGTALDVPGLDRGFDATPDGGDAFVAKLDRNGSVVWATYIGGSDRRIPVGGSTVSVASPDVANAIAVDAAGQVIVGGTTSADNFPVVNAWQATRRGTTDAFIATLSADGRRLIQSSYVGATGDSMSAYGVAVNAAGEMWLATVSPQQRWLASHDLSNGSGRVVILKLNAAGNPIWSTRIGLTSSGGFAVDGAGRPFASGGNCDAARNCQQTFMRLDPSGSQVQFSAGFANRLADVNRSALSLLPGGRAAMSGVTLDPLPLRHAWLNAPNCDGALFNCGDAFLAIANEAGELETVSHLGLGEQSPVIATDVFGRVAISVGTSRINLPLLRPLVDHHVDGPVFVSRDRATTWQVLGRETMPSSGAADLEFDWLRNGLYLLANAIFDSRDDAASWQLDSRGGFGTDVWYGIAVDRRQPSIRYGIFGDHVYRHDAGAGEWRVVSRSAPGTYRRAVVVSPHDSTVWIAGNAGVAMSTTGGDTWSDRSAGLPNLGGSSSTVVDLDFDPTRAGLVYALTQAGLYRSNNNGASWEHLTSAFTPSPNIRAIAFDPLRERTLHLGTSNYGVLTSADDGRTWVRTLDTIRVTAIRTDQMKRHIVYVAGRDADGRSAFYRSIDHGATWHRAEDGLDLTAEPSRMVVDPRDSSKLYLASGSVSAVPYVMRLQRDGQNPLTFTPELATYLAHGQVRAMASTLSGGIVAAVAHGPAASPDHQQTVIVRIAP